MFSKWKTYPYSTDIGVEKQPFFLVKHELCHSGGGGGAKLGTKKLETNLKKIKKFTILWQYKGVTILILWKLGQIDWDWINKGGEKRHSIPTLVHIGITPPPPLDCSCQECEESDVVAEVIKYSSPCYMYNKSLNDINIINWSIPPHTCTCSIWVSSESRLA